MTLQITQLDWITVQAYFKSNSASSPAIPPVATAVVAETARWRCQEEAAKQRSTLPASEGCGWRRSNKKKEKRNVLLFA